MASRIPSLGCQNTPLLFHPLSSCFTVSSFCVSPASNQWDTQDSFPSLFSPSSSPNSFTQVCGFTTTDTPITPRICTSFMFLSARREKSLKTLQHDRYLIHFFFVGIFLLQWSVFLFWSHVFLSQHVFTRRSPLLSILCWNFCLMVHRDFFCFIFSLL